MPSSRSSVVTLMVLAVAILAGGAGLAWWLWPPRPPEPDPAPTPEALFRDAAAEAGITFIMNFMPDEQGEKFKVNLYDHGTAVAVADYDGDGHEDIYLVNQLGPNVLYRNKGDGTFEDRTETAGVALGDRICTAAVFADYDNDGRQDLFVTSVRGGNILFHNEGGGKYRDVTKEAGLHLIAHCQSAHFFDYDNDGKLDLLVTCTAKWTQAALEPKRRYYAGKDSFFDTAGSPVEYNVLYRNNGNGTFSDVTAASGLRGLGWGADAVAFDYDGDGYLDVAITNMFGRSQLYRNRRDGTFVDVTADTLGMTPWGGMGAHAFDFNNDGKLDLYIVDMHSDMWLFPDDVTTGINDKVKYRYVSGPIDVKDPESAKQLKWEQAFADLVKVRYDEVLFGNAFYKNLGGGKFQEMSREANLETFWPWGIAAGDFDNDGFEDVFIPSGMGYPFRFWPNYLMMNNGDETFTNRSVPLGVEPPPGGNYQPAKLGGRNVPRSSRSAAVADFDHDGRLDLIVNNFNDRPYYFRNRGKKGHYVALKLTGTRSNRDAIGAVARLYAGKEVLTRQVHSASGFLSQSSRVLHFGLGDGRTVDRIEIAWPSGRRQTLTAPATDRVHEVTEASE